MSNQFSASYVRRLLSVAAAGVAVLGFIPRAGAAEPDATAGHAHQTLRLPDGFVAKDEDAATGVKGTLVQMTQRAVTKNSYESFYNGFLSHLARRDEAQAQKFVGVDHKQLNDLIGRIQTEWRAKYNQDFGVTDKDLAFYAQFAIVQGEVSDATAAARSWTAAASADQAVNAGAGSRQQARNAKVLTKGRAAAIIRIPAGDGLPEMDVWLLHQELAGWCVDLPADRTGEQLYNDLSSRLNYLATHQDKWPNAVNDGYQMVARSVAAALYGVPYPGGTASAQ
jgi:hypothetical protein